MKVARKNILTEKSTLKTDFSTWRKHKNSKFATVKPKMKFFLITKY